MRQYGEKSPVEWAYHVWRLRRGYKYTKVDHGQIRKSAIHLLLAQKPIPTTAWTERPDMESPYHLCSRYVRGFMSLRHLTNFIGTCEIQVRMICDFSNGEIPTPDGYLVPSLYPPAAISIWHSIIEEAEKVLRCARYGTPGWASDGQRVKASGLASPIGVFIWGKTSMMAKEYLEPNSGGPGFLDSINRTIDESED